jgi:hypothetical protein
VDHFPGGDLDQFPSGESKNDTMPPEPLIGVEVSVRGDAIRVGDIRPGARRTVRLHPRGESDVTLAFTLGGIAHSVTDGYIEAGDGYRVELSVGERGTVFMRECAWLCTPGGKLGVGRRMTASRTGPRK